MGNPGKTGNTQPKKDTINKSAAITTSTISIIQHYNDYIIKSKITKCVPNMITPCG